MRQRRPPSRPRKYKRKGRKYYNVNYWQDRIDEHGKVISRVQIQIPLLDEDGDRITTPRKADRASDRLYRQILDEWNGKPTNEVSLDHYKQVYLDHIPRQGTSRSYATKLQQLFNFLDKTYGVSQLSQVQREMVKAFLDSRLRQVKPVTVHGDLRAVRAFFNEAVRDGRIAESPCKAIRLPSLQGNHASEGFFLPREMDAIVGYCREKEPEWHPIFAGFRYAPFRREELSYLEWTDLDFRRDVIRIQDEKARYNWRPKRSGRTMDLHPTLKQVLSGLEHRGSFIFQHPDGLTFANPITERKELGRRAWRKVKSICDVLELAEKDESGSWNRRFPNGPYLKAFRSGLSCELQLKGVPLAYVQNQLGHHDQSITLEHYTHLVPELMGSLTKKFIGRLGGTGSR